MGILMGELLVYQRTCFVFFFWGGGVGGVIHGFLAEPVFFLILGCA